MPTQPKSPFDATQEHLKDLVESGEVELWHTPEKIAHATINVGDHSENWPLESAGFRTWLDLQTFTLTGTCLSENHISQVLRWLIAQAIYNGGSHKAHARTAGTADKLFIDLVSDTWQVAEVDRNGWRVVDNAPARFVRDADSAPLPMPASDGSLQDLRRALDIADDSHWRLIVSWLVGAFHPKGPYPILILQGSQGSGKSTLSRALQRITDPTRSGPRTFPKSTVDLMAMGRARQVIVLDNIEALTPEESANLCRISTGTTFGKRMLYTDFQEATVSMRAAILANGIDIGGLGSDLMDRSIAIELPRRNNFRTESNLESDLNRILRGAFGDILSALSYCLRNKHSTERNTSQRMADFLNWVEPLERYFGWPDGCIAEDILAARRDELLSKIEANTFLIALGKLQLPWQGSVSELLDAVSMLVSEQKRADNVWPRSATAVGRTLRKHSSTLLEVLGISVTFPPRTPSTRLVRLERG